MEQAEQLLRSRKMRVSEVAHAVGYSHLGHFTEAFKHTFGITPKQCQTGTVNALT
ncbi:helix-turn-helix domain-containing protein [Leptolyngbya sp. 7M]|uniref:helix-turn-helix domain-containing protein n=1 Tax=Leptolyngbya sp. 7M TaxID=2812896 RepID=UPI001B8C6DED|nr:helix-turn-helix domain-containing protein [Leptolyngbya sp. 7M]QYO64799.1 helix-turn-helix domain-containing protein [Leptolyngbya sp. 7M]